MSQAHTQQPLTELSPEFTDTARAALLWVLWTAFDADEQQRMADALKPYVPTQQLLTDDLKELLAWLRKEAEKEDYFGRKHTAKKFDGAANLIEAAQHVMTVIRALIPNAKGE